MPFNHLIFCHPLPLLPSIFPSIRVFSNESVCIRWPKYWSLSISPSNEYSGLISFGIDWYDLFAVKRTLKSLLQHNLKASVLWCSAFSIVQLSHPYMTTGKTIALTIWTFVEKVMSLFFNMQYSFVITFLPRRKHLLISWLQSLSEVILEPKKIKSVTVSIFPIYLHWSDGTGVIIRMFLKGPLCSIQCCCCSVTAGVQLQQPGNQPEGVSGIGGQWCSLWLIVRNYMFISSFRFSFILWQKH